MRLTVIIFAAACALVSMPLAAADEADPDCEAGQPWIGYRSTQTARGIYYANAPGALKTINVCEGEHWDGQDPINSNSHTTGCSLGADPNPSQLYVGMCLGPNPNDAIGSDPLNPLGVRVSSDGGSAYAALNIALVGRAVVYADEGSAAVYLRDNTEGNALAGAISSLRITQGYVDETDCPQSVYQAGAMNPPSDCGRDNTAITVEHGLLA